MDPDMLALGAMWYVVFLFSTTCHEAAHALAARIGGDLTAFHGGQVSIDPWPHIKREPFGMVVFPILSFIAGGWMMGWASAPYDPNWSLRHPHRAAWMSLAGPGANLLLAILAAAGIHAGIMAGVFQPPESAHFTQMVDARAPGLWDAVAKLLSLLFSLNVLLGCFNLLPIPPLDGFTGVGLLMPETTARRWEEMGQTIGRFAFLGLLVAWQLFGAISDSIFELALRVLYPNMRYS
jgi:Zn-dependent protease